MSHLRFPDPATIVLYDDTLRDREQMPGVAFSPEQKVELAALLADIGIDVTANGEHV
jgi:isopropylmalate/homocitrate/citramalate synthase